MDEQLLRELQRDILLSTIEVQDIRIGLLEMKLRRRSQEPQQPTPGQIFLGERGYINLNKEFPRYEG